MGILAILVLFHLETNLFAGVRLDIISMITLLMSEGISVDYVAHISYHYVHAMQMDVPLSKAQRALRFDSIFTLCLH